MGGILLFPGGKGTGLMKKKAASERAPPFFSEHFSRSETAGVVHQNVNRAPNWNCRGVLMVLVIFPKGTLCVVAVVMFGTLGYPSCGALVTL
jgi:hypothetical protein